MRIQVARSLERLKTEVRGITLIAGYPEYAGVRRSSIRRIVMRDGAVLANHRKACLPNYRVFDEKRYFTPGSEPTVVEVRHPGRGPGVRGHLGAEPARAGAGGRSARCCW
jgi:NAD+ synthase (glutamine-hydrolysing)